jgi:acetyl-CoA synthase
MPGFAAIVGAAKTNEVAVEIVRELQRRNILIFLSGNVNGRSIIHQLRKRASRWATIPTSCPLAWTPSRPIYALGFATRSA